MFNRFACFWPKGYFLVLLVLSDRRSGGSSLGFALVAFRPEARKAIARSLLQNPHTLRLSKE